MFADTSLRDLRPVVRARAVEDFEYFANAVLGLGLDERLCAELQTAVAAGRAVRLSAKRPDVVVRALATWLNVLGVSADATGAAVQSEAYLWLFGGHALPTAEPAYRLRAGDTYVQLVPLLKEAA